MPRRFAFLMCLALAGTSVLAWAQPPAQEPGQGQGQGQGQGEEPEDEDEPPYEPAEQPSVREMHTVCEGRTIRRIRVRGNRRVAAEDIRATIQLRRELPCTDTEVARDAHALWDLGFFDDVIVDATPVGENEIDLLFTVRERPAI